MSIIEPHICARIAYEAVVCGRRLGALWGFVSYFFNFLKKQGYFFFSTLCTFFSLEKECTWITKDLN